MVVALLLLLFTLPWRLRRSWGIEHPWQELGILVPAAAGFRAFFRGFLKAAALLFGVVVVLLLSGKSQWQGQLTAGQLLNAIALLLGAGFAEELLFRGWLWGELELLGGRQRAIGLQAAIFALVHPWYQLPAIEAIGLLIGLALLGLALALQRRADQGALWGSVGLHGGLVGGWFALQLFNGLGSDPTLGGVAYWAHAGGFVVGFALTLPFWLRRGGRGYWQVTEGRPPHPEATYKLSRSRIPVVPRRRND